MKISLSHIDSTWSTVNIQIKTVPVELFSGANVEDFISMIAINLASKAFIVVPSGFIWSQYSFSDRCQLKYL